MKALCWHGKNDIRCDSVPDPGIEDARDVVIKVTACAICGSDLHLMDGMMPSMKSGDVLGHEFMGEVVDVANGFTKFKKGSGQTSVKRYLEPLTKLIQENKVDTTSIISHRGTRLEDGPDLYQAFKDKKDGCTKVVFHPAG
jgi:threonine dehydrogenase-like Zn-dependent dehydrogenase